MSQTKKIVSDITESVGEFVKDSAKQVAETIDPIKMVEQAVGIKKANPPTGGEFTNYLKNVGDNLTEAELKQKQQEYANKEGKEMAEAQKIIRNAGLPEHLKTLPKSKPDVFETQKQEDEMKKAQEVEMQKKNPKTISDPGGKTTGKKKQRAKISDFEASKNVKIG